MRLNVRRMSLRGNDDTPTSECPGHVNSAFERDEQGMQNDCCSGRWSSQPGSTAVGLGAPNRNGGQVPFGFWRIRLGHAP